MKIYYVFNSTSTIDIKVFLYNIKFGAFLSEALVVHRMATIFRHVEILF